MPGRADAHGHGPLSLPQGEQGSFLDAGDVLSIRGRAYREGFVSLGFGPCEGNVVPARAHEHVPHVPRVSQTPLELQPKDDR